VPRMSVMYPRPRSSCRSEYLLAGLARTVVLVVVVDPPLPGVVVEPPCARVVVRRTRRPGGHGKTTAQYEQSPRSCGSGVGDASVRAGRVWRKKWVSLGEANWARRGEAPPRLVPRSASYRGLCWPIVPRIIPCAPMGRRCHGGTGRPSWIRCSSSAAKPVVARLAASTSEPRVSPDVGVRSAAPAAHSCPRVRCTP
jgi:hypothetical protein